MMTTMTPVSMLSLALAMLVLAASPGPGVFATVSRAMVSGFRPALMLIAGIVAGDLIYLMFAVMGLSAVAQTFGGLFTVIKICSGAYLIWLGIRIFFSNPSDGFDTSCETKPNSGNFFSGLLITLSNPKVILFYCGFLPAFTDLSALKPSDIIIVSGIVASVLTAVLSTYAYMASQARHLFSGRKAVKRMNRAAGGIMAATGAAIVTGS